MPKLGGTIVTLAQGIGNPIRLALDTSYVYFSDELGAAVMRVPKDGSATATILSGASQPWGIGVDDTYVYWVNTTDSTLRKAPKTGGPSSIITTFFSAPSTDLVVDGAIYANPVGYYYLGGTKQPAGSLVAVAADGGVTTIAQPNPMSSRTSRPFAAGPRYVVSDNLDHGFWWIGIGGANSGGETDGVPCVGGGGICYPVPTAYAADSCSFYFIGSGPAGASSLEGIVALQFAEATGVMLVPPSLVQGNRIAVDSAAVYWTDATAIGRVPLP
jgi:hypothetical protein